MSGGAPSGGLELAPYAARESASRGRRHPEPPPAWRGEYQRDRDRVVHSTAFRRLVYKTQVFVNHEGDLYRTRLTHSLEVAQIGRTVARALRLDESLTEAICLAHDLGHTPFGHAGQDMLNACMQEHGGFEHNLQSLRIVDELEYRYADFRGLNLMFETREGILKHCSARNARELGELGQRFLERRQPGLEAQIANISDAIAYNNHDVDDGCRAGLLSLEQLRGEPLFGDQYDVVRGRYPDLDDKRLLHEVIRGMINRLVNDLIENTRRAIEDTAPGSIDAVRAELRPLVRFSDEMYEQHLSLKRFLNEDLYKHPKVRVMTDRAKERVRDLFGRYFEEPREMAPDFAGPATAGGVDEHRRARIVADFIAGMTDRYAIKEHERLFP